jgi:glycosyltransferase involved in cell wall biosynthesis
MSMPVTEHEGTNRPAVAMICNSLPPYRLHMHARVAREIPQIRLFSILTHARTDVSWTVAPPPEVGLTLFGGDHTTEDQARPRYALREWRKGGRIIRWLKENSVRAVVSAGYNDAGRYRIIRWCKAHGVPCFVWGDSNILGDRVKGLKAIIKKAVVGRIIRSCTGVFRCGERGTAFFAKYGAQPHRMFPFPLEPDYDLIRNITADKLAHVRKDYKLTEHRRRLVFSGRLIQLKRVELLLDAFSAIAPQRPEWDLVIIGDGPMRQELASRVPAELASRITWAGFLDDQPAISAIYRACDALVLPSDYDAWALVLNEAAAAGLAIVCSDVVGAAPELVHDGVNGFTFPRGDLPALTRCLLDVTDPGRIDALKAASTTVLEEWRRVGDPVQGMRQALQFCGVLPQSPTA